jgi:MYXO-CTERM domain-containing protein
MCVSIASAVLAVGTTSAVNATSVTFSGSGISNASGQLLAASASFQTSGTNLIITLTNTSTADVTLQPDILTAVFFDVSGPLLGLGSGSAVVPNTSSVLFGGTDPGGVVGGEWGYAEGISGALSGATGGLVTENYGISSAGFGVFGGATFPGSDLDPPPALNGVNYGITSAGDNPLTGQSAVTGANPLIKNQVVFTLTGLPVNFDPMTSITRVFFQYGTALVPTDPGFEGDVPGPGALTLLVLGGLGMRRRSRR